MNAAILIGITAAVLTIPTITHAQPINEVLGVNFNYTPEQCTQWAIAAKASDTVQSASGGLSQSEFMNFLNSLVTGSDTSITTFGNLPFEVQLGYPALACWCEELGEGEGCCEGGITARINVSALVEENPSEVAIAYKEDFCAFVALVVRELEKMGSAAATTATTTTAVVATSSSTVAPVTTTASTTTAVDTATTITSTQASSPSIISQTDAKGVPGDGVDYLGKEKDGEKEDGEEKDVPKDVLDDENPVVESNEATTSTGLAGGYIFLIILALFAMPVVVFCCGKVNRERNQEEMERVRAFAEEPAV